MGGILFLLASHPKPDLLDQRDQNIGEGDFLKTNFDQCFGIAQTYPEGCSYSHLDISHIK